ncbi:MAG TPA: N-acetylmuramoyl-L-alanine amidase [Candidatus Bathyarchaeia archaeon]|nr:N-acetylmuramoyl-L-alanine amidase [Candidatus Bathyarchaeia archaeon]
MRRFIGMLAFVGLWWGSGMVSYAASPVLIPIHVIIDAGHGGVDGGASYQNLLEKEINLQIAKLLYTKLNQQGYQVVLNRSGDYALSEENNWLNSFSRHLRDLAQRKHLAAELQAEMMVSIHANWASNPTKRGPLVLYQKNNQSFMLADMIQHSLNHVYKVKEEPIQGGRYYLLKQSLCPTVIVEIGYLSNAQDRQWMTNPKQQAILADAIATAISEYFILVGEMEPARETTT